MSEELTPEQQAALNAPPVTGGHASSPTKPRLERIVVTTVDGRVFDLGSPDSRLHALRVRKYKWKRRVEFRAAKLEGAES